MLRTNLRLKKAAMALAVCATVFSVPGQVFAAKPSTATVKRAYEKYASKKLLSNSKYPYGAYTLYDINRDGVPEMFFEYMSGARSGFKIYTYKKKKVVSVKSSTGISCIYYNSGKKQICILTSSGASDNTYTCYKLSGKKLKKVVQYKSVSSGSGMKFYKNKTKISGNQYMSYVGTFDNWNTVRAH